MSVIPGPRPGLEELYRLKYDTKLDLYRRVAHAQEVAAYADFYAALGGDSSGSLLNATIPFYLYKIFGSDIIGSLAFAFDPYWQVSKAPKGAYYAKDRQVLSSNNLAVSIVPINRVRKITRYDSSVTLVQTGSAYTDRNELQPLANGWGLVDAPRISDSTTFRTRVREGGESVDGLLIGDTTWKSRNPNQNPTSKRIRRDRSLQSQGEFELFDVRPGLSKIYWDFVLKDFDYRNLSAVGNNLWLFDKGQYLRSGHVEESVVRFNYVTVPALLASEREYAMKTMVDHVDALFAGTVPNRRYLNTAYSADQYLKTTKGIEQLLITWVQFQRAIGGKQAFIRMLTDPSWWTRSNVRNYAALLASVGVNGTLDKTLSSLYLNFKFNWEQLYRDIVKLLKTLPKAAQDVNRLSARNGKFSNLSKSAMWTEDFANAPDTYVPSFDELTTDSILTSATRTVSLRCVSNVGIRFPDIDQPILRLGKFLEKVGAVPTPGDIYDLIPFTWMVDWFQGLGDYIHLMDAVNGDKSLINYSFLTYESTIDAHTDVTYSATETVSRQSLPPDTVSTPLHEYTNTRKWRFTLPYQVIYRRRIDVNSLTNAKSYAGVNLSDYQATVLGALISQFT